MKLIKSIGAASLLLAATGAMAGNADLVVSAVGSGGSTELQFDMLNDGNATAFQFNLKIGGLGQGVKVESGNCLSGLPSSHTGACNFANGVLKVAVISPTNAPLTSGAIGSITVSAPVSALKVGVEQLMVGNPAGQPVESTAIIDGLRQQENFEK